MLWLNFSQISLNQVQDMVLLLTSYSRKNPGMIHEKIPEWFYGNISTKQTLTWTVWAMLQIKANIILLTDEAHFDFQIGKIGEIEIHKHNSKFFVWPITGFFLECDGLWNRILRNTLSIKICFSQRRLLNRYLVAFRHWELDDI